MNGRMARMGDTLKGRAGETARRRNVEWANGRNAGIGLNTYSAAPSALVAFFQGYLGLEDSA
ncbi:MAG: hypothetical protein JO077_16450 [Verrucomicrobia bacterium]|nr:hypothetical protein [Verrucomicrobiota bacterium]